MTAFLEERNAAEPAEIENKQKILTEIHHYNSRNSGRSWV
jgi:hypothetical protein